MKLSPSMLPLLAIVVAASVVFVACSSRYRTELWRVVDSERKKVDVEETAFASDSRLNNPLANPPVIVGDNCTVVFSLGMRGEPLPRSGVPGAFAFDQYLKYRLYLELPPAPITHADTIPLKGNAYVRLMKFYELPPAEKIYLPDSLGQFLIDSVKSDHLFGTFLNAGFTNPRGERVGFDGQVKFKVR